jgi:hypothetical protein
LQCCRYDYEGTAVGRWNWRNVRLNGKAVPLPADANAFVLPAAGELIVDFYALPTDRLVRQHSTAQHSTAQHSTAQHSMQRTSTPVAL